MKMKLIAATIATTVAFSTTALAGVNIVDGDTITIGGQTIRIIEIDSPESYQPRCEAEEALARKATERLRQLLDTGKVTFRPAGKDRYGRTLAKVYAGKINVGAALIREGYALPYQPGANAKLKRLQAWCGPTATLDDYSSAKKPMQFAQSQDGQQQQNVSYKNCAAARAAGAAPIHYGEPGYRPKLDRDRDGVACE